MSTLLRRRDFGSVMLRDAIPCNNTGTLTFWVAVETPEQADDVLYEIRSHPSIRLCRTDRRLFTCDVTLTSDDEVSSYLELHGIAHEILLLIGMDADCIAHPENV
ncbi:MAG: hypothetical protein WC498_03560 [Candidatus Saccharimonadales bacterium]